MPPVSDDEKTDTGNPIQLEETVVTGTRVSTPQDILPSPVTVVNREALENNGSYSLLPTLSEQVPGLFVTSRGIAGYGTSTGSAGNISIRGLGGQNGRILILIDGHPQYASIYGHPVADSYIQGDAERIEVIRGASSVLYGSNAMGGTVNIITRKPQQPGNHLHARISGGSYGTRQYIIDDSYSSGRFFVYAGGTVERTDGHRPNSAFDSYSGMAKASYEISNVWKVSANANLTKFHALNPGEEATPLNDAGAVVSRGMSEISVENAYSNTSGAINLYYNWGDHEVNDGYMAGEQPQEYPFISTDYMAGANIFQSFHAYRGNTVTAGFDAKFYGGNAYRNPETEIYADHKNLHELAGYLFVQQKWKRLMGEAGIRMESHSLYGNEWIPQAGLSYSAPWGTAFKFSYSKGFRTPNLKELYMFASANEELKPERSQSFDLQFSQHFLDSRLHFELCLFHTVCDNMVETVIESGRPRNRNTGEYSANGIEAAVSYRILDDLTVKANYSYLHPDRPVTGAPAHKAYVDAGYSPRRFSLHAGAQLVNGLYLQTGDNAMTESFILIDARAAYRPVSWCELSVKGENLLNRSYQTMKGMPMPGTTFMAGMTVNL